MDALKILFLAVLQGITEFLPVSSSGHLAIAHNLLGIEEPPAFLAVMLHFGTLLSVMVYFRRRIADILRGLFSGKRETVRLCANIAIASVPAAISYFLLGDFIENCFEGNVKFVGAMLLATGAVLLSMRFLSGGRAAALKARGALAVGIAQALALLPGISRSGSTIAAARFLGMKGEPAAEFSFLMSLPVLAGAVVLQLLKFLKGETHLSSGESALPVLCAVLVSAVVGYFSIRLLMRALAGRRFWLFGLYCICAGLLALCL